MSVVLPRQTGLGGFVPHIAQRVYQQLTWRHGIAIVLATLAMTVADLAYLYEKLDRPGIPLIMGFSAVSSLVLFAIALVAWMAAVEAGADRHQQLMHLVVAIVGTAALTAAITMPVMYAVGVDDAWMALMDRKRDPPPYWLKYISTTVQLSVFAFLFVAAAEMLRRRSVTQLAVRSAQREQAAIAREVLESRLTAMQAQVEPQFLFDSLVDIEALYRQDAGRAAGDLDRLITYLRVALPRLREPGSTIDAEIELVQAYLAVVTSLHNGRPELIVNLPDDCRQARFYPMLLLPLLQRAVRHPTGKLPESIKIGISRVQQEIVIVLRFAVPDHCDEDPELVRVRERLSGLYGAAASLDCQEVGGITQIIMRIPAAFAMK
ncbi:MAG: histidine kinase [Burkholderiaceae bacterium]